MGVAEYSNTLALDEKKMTNTTIWFSLDGYRPEKNAINGRRMAGNSFLKGYMRHAKTDVFRGMAYSGEQMKYFEDFAEPYRNGRALDVFNVANFDKVKETEVLYYSGPSIGIEAWRRYPYGQACYSICGITHTTATVAVMEQIFNLQALPVAPWDALICTSNTVKQSVEYQMELAREYYQKRLGANDFARPMMPILPIGINCDEFQPDDAMRKAFRDQHNIADDDIVIGVISRLSPHEKFDPIPFLLAIAKAQILSGKRIFPVFCGEFQDPFSQKLFEKAAKRILKGSAMIVLDGSEHENRIRTLSASDIFSFPIDNIQETFGLSPIEGMAAGLPIIATDWNGMKDTVSEDVGFRIPTRMAGEDNLENESLRHRLMQDKYYHYLTLQTASTEFDVGMMAEKIALLANDENLRKKMGAAGRKRAHEVYDWSVVIPQMEALWDEQNAMRLRASQEENNLFEGIEMPIAPRATKLFAAYPTQNGFEPDERFERNPALARGQISEIFEMRGYKRLKRALRPVGVYVAIYDQIGEGKSFREMLDIGGGDAQRKTLELALIWLLKYDFIRKVE